MYLCICILYFIFCGDWLFAPSFWHQNNLPYRLISETLPLKFLPLSIDPQILRKVAMFPYWLISWTLPSPRFQPVCQVWNRLPCFTFSVLKLVIFQRQPQKFQVIITTRAIVMVETIMLINKPYVTSHLASRNSGATIFSFTLFHQCLEYTTLKVSYWNRICPSVCLNPKSTTAHDESHLND